MGEDASYELEPAGSTATALGTVVSASIGGRTM
jgi:hypothetical protein